MTSPGRARRRGREGRRRRKRGEEEEERDRGQEKESGYGEEGANFYPSAHGLLDGFEDPVDSAKDIEASIERNYARDIASLSTPRS
ncbi:uncharacterized protein N7518_008254 [Penicillium psychrosexuale]|uniref:uncharacterized protein n=1 Tax=Penicillium psychrosexuale TaxID=1002107 RepID=UPI002544F4DC|nr:uncharacterized protein N7518_008254 [Penicillium psychrosexuale]KAJ5791243.1 hypothetical protein N7518_008254 [Penicillium psychrosexuale]